MKQKPHAYQRFQQDFKSGKTGNLLLLTGKEQFLCEWAIEQIKKKYITNGMEFMDMQVLDGWEFNASQLIAAAEALPTMSDKRLVLVRNFKSLEGGKKYLKPSDQKLLEKYIENVSESTVLVFTNELVDERASITKALKKYGKWYDFGPLEKADFRAFAKKRLNRAGLEISPERMEFLMDSTGYLNRENEYNLYQFENDLSKLLLICDGNGITDEDIENTVCRAEDLFVFNLLENIMAGRKEQAFVMLKGIVQDKDGLFGLISLMASQYEMLLAVKQLQSEGMNKFDIAKTLKANSYRVAKLMPFARRKTEGEIKKSLSMIYEIPRQIKTGLMPADLAMQLFIAEA